MVNGKTPKLFMLLLGSKAPGRTVEQHDYFFGIASALKELVPAIKSFWPEAGNTIHIDAWREVTFVNGYSIEVIPRHSQVPEYRNKLFFINLGGYKAGEFTEHHYTFLTIHQSKAEAIKEGKQTAFFKTNSVEGGKSHVDDKYGIDVDNIYAIEELLSANEKLNYAIKISIAENVVEDEIHLGYFKLNKLPG